MKYFRLVILIGMAILLASAIIKGNVIAIFITGIITLASLVFVTLAEEILEELKELNENLSNDSP